jgi:hypothetical protein
MSTGLVLVKCRGRLNIIELLIDFSFKSYGKESLYKYCMNVDDGRIVRSWGSCLLFFLYTFPYTNELVYHEILFR